MNVFNHPSIQRIARVLQTDANAKGKTDSAPGVKKHAPKDSVDLSQEARILAGIRKRLSETPDVRHDKVEALKQAIENGTYRPSAEDIADAILREGKLP